MREVEDAGSVVIFVSGRFMAPLRVRTDGDVQRDDGGNHMSMGAELYKCCWGRFFGDKSSTWGRLMG